MINENFLIVKREGEHLRAFIANGDMIRGDISLEIKSSVDNPGMSILTIKCYIPDENILPE